MFTGIIRDQGRVVEVIRRPRPRLVVLVPRLAVRRGNSVAVDGVCLTVISGRRGRLTFDLLAETLRTTTLGARQPGDGVNLELALRLGDPVDGHLMLGHVDGVGRVVARRPTAAGLALTITAPPAMRPYLAPKGAVAVDGVSLTVAPRLTGARMTVYLIPHTAAVTTLGRRRPGDLVNLEADPLARYAVARRWSIGHPKSPVP